MIKNSDIPVHLPVASACLRNQDAILDVLRPAFSKVTHVLEIGSGTGQHAVHCAAAMPHLQWQPTELKENIPNIEMWRTYAGLINVKPPLSLDVSKEHWSTPGGCYDAVFTANTFHFVGWSVVKSLFAGLAEVISESAVFAVYGPFNDHGQCTSEGNRALDIWLKQRDTDSGIKNLDDVIALALHYDWPLKMIHSMPANNLILEFYRAKGL